MPESALGHWLKALRDDRRLSLREVSQRGEVDHAYIYRLETGAKELPSAEVINKLIAALTPSARDAEILRFLASHPNVNVDGGLADFVAPRRQHNACRISHAHDGGQPRGARRLCDVANPNPQAHAGGG